MRRVIYIAGYGRSGSSLIELALEQAPEVRGRGEAAMLEWAAGRGLRCSCYEPVASCKDWAGTVEALNRIPWATAHRFAERNIFGALLLSALRSTRIGHAYTERVQVQLFGPEGESSPPLTVDSSKTARGTRYRPRLLARVAQVDLYVLHVVRAPGEVIESLVAGSNWAHQGLIPSAPLRLRAIRAVLGWVAANRAALRTKRVASGDRYRTVSLVSLQADPVAVLTGIFTWLALPMDSVPQIVESGIIPTHSLAGNRLRFESNIKIRTVSERLVDPDSGVIAGLVLRHIAGPLYEKICSAP